MGKVSSEYIGRAGEFLAACIFEVRGIRTVPVTMHGVDLWCETPSGRWVRVQVKTASKAHKEANRYGAARYCFSRRVGRAVSPDLYAFVALDLMRVVVRDYMCANARITVDDFSVAAQEDSIARWLY